MIELKEQEVLLDFEVELIDAGGGYLVKLTIHRQPTKVRKLSGNHVWEDPATGIDIRQCCVS